MNNLTPQEMAMLQYLQQKTQVPTTQPFQIPTQAPHQYQLPPKPKKKGKAKSRGITGKLEMYAFMVVVGLIALWVIINEFSQPEPPQVQTRVARKK